MSRESMAVFTLYVQDADPTRPVYGVQCEVCGWTLELPASQAGLVVLRAVDHRCPDDNPWHLLERKPDLAGVGA
jgi:hypothetical protein